MSNVRITDLPSILTANSSDVLPIVDSNYFSGTSTTAQISVSALANSMCSFGNNSNYVTGSNSNVLGGINNNATGNCSSIIGGSNNIASNNNAFVLGSGITTLADNYTYVNNLSTNGIVNTNTLQIASLSATTGNPSGSVVAKMPIYNAGGTFIGWIPVYNG